MKNSFGARITQQSNDSALQPFMMVFDKTISLESRNNDMALTTKIAEQVFFIDPNLNYSLMIANQSQAKRIEKLPSIASIGGVNIDFERFQQIMSGNI